MSWGNESKQCLCRLKSHLNWDDKDDVRNLNWDDVDDVRNLNSHRQGQWENLPPELLLDIIRRVEESETVWPARAAVVHCASVCKSWRSVTKEIIKNLQQCGKITFPISLKEPGPRDHRMQCYIQRNRRTSTFLLYLCLRPSLDSRKLLLAAKWKRWLEFAISLAADDFSQAKCVGKLRSNFWGTKFAIYDTEPPQDAAVQPNCQSSERFDSKKVSPSSVPADNHLVSTISYEWRTNTPRRVHCVMNSIPLSTIQDLGNALTPISLPEIIDSYSTRLLSKQLGLNQGALKPLVLKNKAARWDDWCKSWCLDYMGRTIKSSGRNFQLVADADMSQHVSLEEQERVILNFGKVGKDIFIMEYSYPLSTFEAFSICLTSFICNMYKSKCKA